MSDYPQIFDYQDWQQKELANKAAAQTLETGAMEQDLARMKLNMAKQAAVAQEAIAKTLRNTPGLESMIAADPASLPAIYAGMLARSGQVEAGAEMVKLATMARETSNNAMKLRTEDNIKTAELVGGVMREVITSKDPKAAWERGEMYLRSVLGKEHMKQLDWLRDLPKAHPNFDYVDAAKQFADATTSAVEAAQKEQALAAAEYNTQKALLAKEQRETLVPAQADAAAALAEQRRKTGDAKLAGASATLSDAKKRIQSEFDIEDPELNSMAMKVAEDARTIQLSQPLLGRTKALEVAYEQAKRDNLFAGHAKKPTALGTSPAAPKPIPMIDGQVDTGKIQPNFYYQFGEGFGQYSGMTVLWDGKTFVPVKKGKK